MQDAQAEVYYAYQLVTGIFPDVPAELYAQNDQIACAVAEIVHETLGVRVPWGDEASLLAYANEVEVQLQHKDD